MKHSFAVLAYKESPFITECIESLLNQSVTSEIYITTSTPSAYLAGISKQYNIELYVNPDKPGIASDWNFAITRCQTPLLTLAHQDDIYLAEYTARMVHLAEKSPDLLIGFSDYSELFQGEVRSNTLNLFIKRILVRMSYFTAHAIRSGFRKKSLIAFGSPIPCPSVMYHLGNLDHFRFSPEYQVNLDWDAWLRIAGMNGSIGHVNRKLMVHRIHGESETTSALGDNRRQNEDLKLFNRIWPGWIARGISFLYRSGYNSNS